MSNRPPAVPRAGFSSWVLAPHLAGSGTMARVRRAVIDVGTNSVKLLVAEVDGRAVSPLVETSHQTRLGAGFYTDHLLQPDRIAASAEVVQDFAATAREHGVEHLCVLATSAARDAKNQEELLRALESAAGVKVRVLTGDEEAHWAFSGATSDPRYCSLPVLLLEVGGGSTQLIAGHGEHLEFLESFPLGTVRLFEHFPHSNPPTDQEYRACADHVESFAKEKIQPQAAAALSRFRRNGPTLSLAAGGTASVLGCLETELDHFDREALESVRLPIERLRAWERRLWSLSLEERRALRGLPPKRADVILMGVLVYRTVCEVLGIEELRISTRGLRFGALL